MAIKKTNTAATGTRAAKSEAATRPALIKTIASRLRDNERVRRSLPGWGRIHVDRQVPFLCAYRRASPFEHLKMQNLVTSEAAYLYTEADKPLYAGIHALVGEIVDVMVEQFGAFLLLEIWPVHFAEVAAEQGQWAVSRPRFRVVTPRRRELGGFIDKFIESLSRIKIDGQAARVEVDSRSRIAPPQLRPLLTSVEAEQKKCLVLGLEISPLFADLNSGEVFPLVQRQLERSLTVALHRTFFDFARIHTTHRPPHYHALGRRALVKAVWQADRLLAGVCDEFDFLLQVSPTNGIAAWRDFQRNSYRKPPTFHYRPLPIDPVLLKRELYATPVERVEDPAIGQLLRDKVAELDRQIGSLLEINTPQFVHSSMSLYGGVEESLLARAEAILKQFPRDPRAKSRGSLDAHAFASRAREEIAFLRQQGENVQAQVEVRDDINGLIVSRGSLLVGSEVTVPRERVAAVLQHEIGTHVLTYYNGRAQPFRQLSSGLSGYEALQEGIAVLSEFLVRGLGVNRLRLLAARVVVVRMMLDGATFVECFQRLVDQFRFVPRAAFNIAMRVFRGGGLTKDAIYLRGLLQTLEYLRNGGELEPLLIGKIGAHHIPLMKELKWRKVLSEPMLTPRYMKDPDALARLDRVRGGMDVQDLIEPNRGRTVPARARTTQNPRPFNPAKEELS